VAEIIALKSNSHVLAESGILPACQKMVKVMLGDKPDKTLAKYPFQSVLFREELLTCQATLSKV